MNTHQLYMLLTVDMCIVEGSSSSVVFRGTVYMLKWTCRVAYLYIGSSCIVGSKQQSITYEHHHTIHREREGVISCSMYVSHVHLLLEAQIEHVQSSSV